MVFERRCKKTSPLLDIYGEWEPGSFYPDRLHVAMADGNIIRYRIDILAKPAVGLHGWKTRGKVVDGYGYKKAAQTVDQTAGR